MSNKKSWSEDAVAIAHNYQEFVDFGHLDSFVKYCNDLIHKGWVVPGNRISILDLGCGNGRAVIALNRLLGFDFTYLGLDINDLALKSGIEGFQKNNLPRPPSIAMLSYFDVDEMPWNHKIMNMTNRFNVCLIDSTIHMFGKPIEVLKECDKRCDYIYVTRTKLEISVGIQKTSFAWGGMSKPSDYWKFSKKFFDDFAAQTNRTVSYNQGPSPETYAIALERKI